MQTQEAQDKWDLMNIFSYSYICQPPKIIKDNEQAMVEREMLFQMAGNNIHVTNWKTIYSVGKETSVIRLANLHAKKQYHAALKGTNTQEYEAIKCFAERAKWEATIIRSTPGCNISYICLYMKTGDKYSQYTTPEKKKKK